MVVYGGGVEVGVGVIHGLVGVHEPVQRRWGISGACLSRPASPVSNGVVVVIEVGSRRMVT